MLIKEIINNNDIICIWSEAFDDSKEDIQFFIDNVKEAKCYGVYIDDLCVSMTYIVNCKLNEKLGGYIYAACTLKDYQKHGYMNELLKYAFNLDYDFICLIPADKNLVDYYSSRGFDYQVKVEKVTFNQSVEIDEYLHEGCILDQPFMMLNKKG